MVRLIVCFLKPHLIDSWFVQKKALSAGLYHRSPWFISKLPGFISKLPGFISSLAVVYIKALGVYIITRLGFYQSSRGFYQSSTWFISLSICFVLIILQNVSVATCRGLDQRSLWYGSKIPVAWDNTLRVFVKNRVARTNTRRSLSHTMGTLIKPRNA